MDVMTNGEREIDGRRFYLHWRAAHYIIFQYAHLLRHFCMRVDARLHALLAAGMLVTSADAFAIISSMKHGHGASGVGTHRVVYGATRSLPRFDEVRRTIATTARDGKTLQTRSA